MLHRPDPTTQMLMMIGGPNLSSAGPINSRMRTALRPAPALLSAPRLASDMPISSLTADMIVAGTKVLEPARSR